MHSHVRWSLAMQRINCEACRTDCSTWKALVIITLRSAFQTSLGII